MILQSECLHERVGEGLQQCVLTPGKSKLWLETSLRCRSSEANRPHRLPLPLLLFLMMLLLSDDSQLCRQIRRARMFFALALIH